MRAGQAKITSSSKTVKLSSDTDALIEVAFLSVTNEDDTPMNIEIFATTTNTGVFYDSRALLYSGKIDGITTQIWNSEDFPYSIVGDTHFGASATDMILYVGSPDSSPDATVYYSVFDASAPRSLSGAVNFTGDSGAGGLQGLVPAPGAGDAAAGKYLDSDGTWTTPPDTTPDATNVGAAGALMDSEVTNLAEVKAFSSADYATAAQGTTADAAQQPPTEGAFVDGDKTKLDGIATGAEVNVQSDWNSLSGDNLILNKPTVTTFTEKVATGNILWKQAKVTLSEVQLNALHTAPITLIAAQGADSIIMCGDAIALIDRDASTAQASSSCDLVIGYDSTTDYNKAILYERRFMYNELGDKTWSLKADYSGEVADSVTGAVNVPVTAAFTAACTSGSLDSVTIYLPYYVIDNS